ncbi:MAG: glycine zipper 2TM domain-containing protein [Xanthomonadales bacterium]|nr:glycine zipper 2TM domain-containing protein [Xanthomonadales bacterium]
MKRLNMSILAILAASVSLPVLAAQDNGRYVWADVIEATPVTRVIRKPVREEVCWQEEVYREIPARRSAAPSIFGALLGGVIGNQFGGGSGRDVMTVAGAALGGAIAADRQRERHPNRYYASLEDRCGTNTNWQETRQVIGWDVVYEYQGETYLARMPDRPGDQIEVEVSVQPVSP